MLRRVSRRIDLSRRTVGHTPALFALAVIVPGLVLTALGLVTLRQDRRLADQQVRERRDVLADRAVTALERELRAWDEGLSALPLDADPVPTAFPPLIRTVLERSSLAVLVASKPGGTRSWPPRRLLYDVDRSLAQPPRPLPPAVAAAERIELMDRDLVRAAAAYRALLAAAGPARADVLLRLARTYRKSGREDLAEPTYRDLERLTGTTSDGVPVDLLAGFALCAAAPTPGRAACALAVYRDLVDGRWRLDRVWYWAYSGQARGLVSDASSRGADIEKVAAREVEKSLLTRAVESLFAEGPADAIAAPVSILTIDSQTFLTLAAASPLGVRSLVLPVTALREHVWPVVFGSLLDEVTVTLADSDGAQLFASGGDEPAASSAVPLAATRLLRHAALTWKIDIRLRDPEVLHSGFRRRQWLYMAMLVVMTASLAAGTALTLRTVSRELAVARLKSQFVSAVSHEFRTPLTGIRHYVEMLLDGRVATDDRRRHYYTQVLAASDRLSRLVEDVLDFARLEEGRQEYRFDTIDTAVWLRQTVADFQSTLGQDKRLQSTVPATLSPIRGDGPALARAIHNLLDNAVKYSPGRDTIWLEAQEQDSAVAISVRDRGVGISASDQPHIFERFFRGHSSIPSVRGAGLGLSLVQHVVAAHHGSIDVDSEPGLGTTVTIRVPLSLARPEAPCAS